MKKILTVIFLFFAITAFSFAVNFPKPVGYVNDFDNILSAEQRNALEAKLSAYERITSIEIAVVTVPDLDGLEIEEWANKLFKEWGIGKKDSDNGLLLVVVKNDRVSRFEVGYGLEGDLPDALTNRIFENQMKPAFRNENYSLGINQAVTEVIRVLSKRQSPEQLRAFSLALTQAEAEQVQKDAILRREMAKVEAEQAERRAAEEKERKARAKEMWDNFLAVLVSIAIVVVPIGAIVLLVIWIISIFKELKRKRLLRIELVTRLDSNKDKFNKRRDELNETKKKVSSTFPAWAMKDANALLASAFKELREIHSAHIAVETGYKKFTDTAAGYMKKAEDGTGMLADYLKELNENLPAEIKKYEKKAPVAVSDASSALNDTSKLLQSAMKKGFRLSEQEKGLTHLKGIISKNEQLLEDKRNSKDVIEKMAEVEENVKRYSEDITATVNLRDQNEKKIKVIPANIADIKKSIPVSERILEGLKKNNPRDNWASLEKNFLMIPALLVAAESLLKSAAGSNSMEQQKFSFASQELSKLGNNLQKAVGFMNSIEKTEKDIEAAKKSHKAKLSEADSKISSAQSAVSHSDVARSTKNKAHEAIEKLSSAKKALEASSINWLLVIMLLIAAIGLADEAISDARRDKREAEEERERERRRKEEERLEREAEKRRKKEREEQERKDQERRDQQEESRRSSESHTFGGGSSGGGGSTGRW